MNARRAAFALASASAAAGLLIVVTLRLWPSHPAIDPRAMALLEASDQRLQRLHSIEGEIQQKQSASFRQIIKFRLMQPTFSRVRSDTFGKKSGSRLWTPTGYRSESHSDGKNYWNVYQPLGGKPRFRRYAAVPQIIIRDVPLFTAMFNPEGTHYQQLIKSPTREELVSVRYEGIQNWQGMPYKSVRVKGIARHKALPLSDLVRGRLSPVSWLRAQSRASSVARQYELHFLIGEDDLIHRQTNTTYERGSPPFVQDTQLRSVKIEPKLSPGDFRYAPPAGAAIP